MAMTTNRISLISDVRPDERARRRSSRQAGPEHLRHRLSLPLGIIAIVGGLALGAVAFPHLIAAIAVVQARPIAERFISGERGPYLANVEHAGERLQFALGLAPDADTAVLLADLRLWQARRAADTKTTLAYARQSAEAAKLAIRHAPAHATAWTALADALEVLNPGDASVVAPLSRALLVSPYDPRRRRTRVNLAMRHWQALPPQAQKAAGPPIVAMARADLDVLARLTKQNLALGAVRDALAADAELARRFDAAYIALPN
ncbi:MAG: hypothetical protein AB7O88_05930 [Reyranellaceae bacterium]